MAPGGAPGVPRCVPGSRSGNAGRRLRWEGCRATPSGFAVWGRRGGLPLGRGGLRRRLRGPRRGGAAPDWWRRGSDRVHQRTGASGRSLPDSSRASGASILSLRRKAARAITKAEMGLDRGSGACTRAAGRRVQRRSDQRVATSGNDGSAQPVGTSADELPFGTGVGALPIAQEKSPTPFGYDPRQRSFLTAWSVRVAG